MTKHLYIKGHVQGVFYRASARKVADGLGITGWIRNRSSGDVEAMVSGKEDMISAFIDWCRIGPPGARVEQVDITETGDKSFEGFNVQRSK